MSLTHDRTHKWWGWGHESEVGFDFSARPGAWPFIASRVDAPIDPPIQNPIGFDAILLPPSRATPILLGALERAVGAAHVSVTVADRVNHAYGKSFADLWRARRGRFDRAPDVIVCPQDEEAIEAVLKIAVAHDALVIPFGGGTNICGALDPEGRSERPVISLDMAGMDRILSIDPISGSAYVQAGIFGPALEKELQRHGLTLGHFPDSFLYSTLGGWVATRSSGMQSDRYGNIEDLVQALTVITPVGRFSTHNVPRRSAGPELRETFIGSEGIFGVIAAVVIRVRPTPERRIVRGFLFPDFASGVESAREVVKNRLSPVMFRLNDVEKTGLTFAFKETQPWPSRLLAQAVKKGIKSFTRVDPSSCCLAIVGFEGDNATIRRETRAVKRVFSRHGAVDIGTGLDSSFEKSKFDYPHLRDFIMDRGVVADVSETSTQWSNVMPLYNHLKEKVGVFAANEKLKVTIGCHVSHTYSSGASLYFTYAFYRPNDDALELYRGLKACTEEAFLEAGGTLSHHHSVGTEHRAWLAREVSPEQINMIRAVKRTLDPSNIMNPGKLLTGDDETERSDTATAPLSPSRQL